MPIQDKEALRITESILSLLAEPILVLNASFQAMMANPAFYETLRIKDTDVRGKSVEEILKDQNGEYINDRTLLNLVKTKIFTSGAIILYYVPGNLVQKKS